MDSTITVNGVRFKRQALDRLIKFQEEEGIKIDPAIHFPKRRKPVRPEEVDLFLSTVRNGRHSHNPDVQEGKRTLEFILKQLN